LIHVAKKCREAENKLPEKYSEYLLLPVDKVNFIYRSNLETHQTSFRIRQKIPNFCLIRQNSTRKDPQANKTVLHQFSDAILWCSTILPHGFKRCTKDVSKRAAIVKSAGEDLKKNSIKEMPPTGGFVFCSVLTALVCASVFDEFTEAMQSILELGGDADT
jgi:hypothetical protein